MEDELIDLRRQLRAAQQRRNRWERRYLACREVTRESQLAYEQFTEAEDACFLIKEMIEEEKERRKNICERA